MDVWTVCVLYEIPPITMFVFPVNVRTRGKLGSLGFALAKGLIRGLINRYPDPLQATDIS